MPPQENALTSLPDGFKLNDQGQMYYDPGALTAPGLSSTRPLSSDFDERMRRYYGERMEGSINPLNPLMRGYQQGLTSEVGGLIDAGEWATDSDYLQDLGKKAQQRTAKIPMRSVMAGDIKNLADLGGYIAENAASFAGQMTPYAATILFPEPSSTAAGAVGLTGKVAGWLGKGARLGAGSKKAGVGRSALVGMTASATGRQHREIRDITGSENRPLALGSGIVQGQMNRVPLGLLFNSKSTGKRFYTDVIRSALGVGGAEMVTEMFQEATQLGTNKIAADMADKTYDLVNENNAFRIIDAGLAGLAGGAPMGAIGAVGNYTIEDPSPEEDAELIKAVQQRLDMRTLKNQGRLAVYTGLIDGLQKRINNKTHFFNSAEIEGLDSFVEDIDSLEESDEKKRELKNSLSSLVVQAKSRVAPQKTEVEAPSELEKQASELVKSAQATSGVDLEQEQADEDVDTDIRSQRQIAVDSATELNPINETLAPFEAHNEDLDYRAALSRGAPYLHKTEMGLVPAKITKIDSVTGRVTQAVWNGRVVLDEQGPAFTLDQINAATDAELGKLKKARSPVEEVNQVVDQIRLDKEAREQAAVDQAELQKELEKFTPIKTGQVDVKEIQLLAQVPKVPASIAKNIPDSMLTPQQRRQRTAAKPRKSGSKLKKRSYFTTDKAKKPTAEAVVEQAVGVKPDKPATGSRRAAQTGRKPATKVGIVKTDKGAAAKELTDEEQIAEVKGQLSSAVRRAATLAPKIVKQDSTNMILFSAPISLEKLNEFFKEVINVFKLSFKLTRLQLRQSLKKKEPTKSEILAEYKEVAEIASGEIVESYARQWSADSRQFEAIRVAIVNYFEEARKRKSLQGARLLDSNGDMTPKFNEILDEIIDQETGVPTEKFVKWISDNMIQVPRGAEFHKLGRSAVLINSVHAKNTMIKGDEDSDRAEALVPVEGPKENETASTLYNDNGQSADAYFAYSVNRGAPVITIQADEAGEGKQRVYKLKPEIAKKLKTDPLAGPKNKTKSPAFAYLPYDYVWDENGDFKESNWEIQGKKSAWKFSLDVPHSMLDRDVFLEQLSSALKKKGSNSLSGHFSGDNQEGLDILNGYISFARRHHAMDKSKDFNPKNIFKDYYKSRGSEQISRMNTQDFASALKASIRAASHRAIQDYNRGVKKAEEEVMRSAERGKGEGVYRRYRDDSEFERIVIKRVKPNLVTPLGNSRIRRKLAWEYGAGGKTDQRESVPLESVFDHFVLYIETLGTRLSVLNRKLDPDTKSYVYSDSRRRLVREERDDIKGYLDDANLVKENITKGIYGRDKSGKHLSYRESSDQIKAAEKGELRTVGLFPLMLDESTRDSIVDLKEYLQAEEGSGGFPDLELKAYMYTLSRYNLPIASHSVKFKKEITKMVSEEFADKILHDGDPNAVSFQLPTASPDTVTPKSLEVDDYTSDAVIDEEMIKLKATDSASDKRLKTELGRARKAYSEGFDSEERTMASMHDENARLVIAHEDVNYEVFDGDAEDSLPSSSRKASEKAVAKVDAVLMAAGVIDKESGNDEAALIRFLGMVTKPVHTMGSARLASRRIKIEEFLKAKRAELQVERREILSRNEDQDMSAFDAYMASEMNDHRDLAWMKFREAATKKELNEDAVFILDYDNYSALIGMIGLAYGRGEKAWKTYLNKTFDIDPNVFAKLAEEKYSIFGGDLGKKKKKLSPEEKEAAEMWENAAEEVIDRRMGTPFKVVQLFIDPKSKQSKSKTQQQFFRHQLRAFVKGRRFRSKFDNRALFAQLLKMSVEFNEGTILDRWNNNNERDLSKLHFVHESAGRETTGLSLFSKFKVIAENHTNMLDVLNSPEWSSDARFMSDDSKRGFVTTAVQEAEAVRESLRERKPVKPKKAGEVEAKLYQLKLDRWNDLHKKANASNIMRLRLLRDLTDDLVSLVTKQAGISKALFRRLMGIKGGGSTSGRQQMMASSIDDVLEFTSGAYGQTSTKEKMGVSGILKSPFGKRHRTKAMVKYEAYDGSIANMGAYDFMAELFELPTIRTSVPKAFLDKGFIFRSGKTSGIWKQVMGKPDVATVEADNYRPIVKATGANGIKEVLGDYAHILPEDMVQQGMDLLTSIPEKYFEGMDFVVSEDIVKDNVKLSGGFFELNGRMTAAVSIGAKHRDNAADAIAHELSHGLFAYISDTDVRQINSLRASAIQKLARGAGTRHQQIVAQGILSEGGDISTSDYYRNVIGRLFPEGTEAPSEFKSAVDSIYPLINNSEYFAHLMTNEGMVTQFEGLPYVAKSRVEGILNKVKEFLKQLLGYLTKHGNLNEELKSSISKKFKDGTFSTRRRLLKHKHYGKYEYKYEVEKAVQTDYRDGANKAAARLIAKEAGAASKLLTGLITEAINELSLDERYSGMLLNKDGKVDPAKQVTVLTHLKRNKEIQQYLEEFSSITEQPSFSPQTYLELAKSKKEMPESVWVQTSRNVALNLQFFVNGFQKLKERGDKFNSEKFHAETAEILADVGEKYFDAQHVKAVANQARVRAWELLKQAKATDRQSEAAKLLKSFRFSLAQINDQVNERTLGGLNKVIGDMYSVLMSTEEGRAALVTGRSQKVDLKNIEERAVRGAKVNWKKLVSLYREIASASEELDVYGIPKKKGKVETTPMHALAAWHLSTVHDIDRREMKAADDILREAELSYEEYHQDLHAVGPKRALDKILSDLRKSSKQEGLKARAYLSTRSKLRSRVKAMSETNLAVEVLKKVVESRDFIESRKLAIKEVGMRPADVIEFKTSSYELPMPDSGEVVSVSMDVTTKDKLNAELVKVDDYINKLSNWIEKNPDHVFNFFWMEMKDHASTLLNNPTIRRGGISERSTLLGLGKLGYKHKQLDNVLGDLGGYPARVARQLLFNQVEASERAEDWKREHEEKIAHLNYLAAKSHGFGTDAVGVAKWRRSVAKRYFALANKEGRRPKVGDEMFLDVDNKMSTLTQQDEDALVYQSSSTNKLFEMNLRESRGPVAEGRKVEDTVRGKDGMKVVRRPIKSTDTTLPKTFDSKSIRFAEKVHDYYKALSGAFKEINDRELPEDVAREMKLSIYKEAKIAGKSLYDVIGSEWDFVQAFLDEREGKITSGTRPYFISEEIYDGARDDVMSGEITNLEELGAYFAKRSVDLNKVDPEGETDYSLTKDEALYELLREMVFQIERVHSKVNPEMDSDSGVKVVAVQDRNSFNTARQEAIANWYFYDYGITSTTALQKLISDSHSQYLDEFSSSLDSVIGYLQKAVSDLDENIDNFTADKRNDALAGENFIKYDSLKTDLAKIQSLKLELSKVQDRDVRFDQAMNAGARMNLFNDLTGAALQSSSTGMRNLLGTPSRTDMRLQTIFGFSFRMKAESLLNLGKALLEVGATGLWGVKEGVVEGAKAFAKTKGGRTKAAVKTFLTKSLDEAWVKEITVGQFKINENIVHIAERGYGIRSDTGGRFDNWFKAPETRGRIEREDELLRRREGKFGNLRKRLVEIYNYMAFAVVETGSNVAPRMFDLTGNNISFRQANVVARVLDGRLKKMHDLYGSKLFDKFYNEPDVSYTYDKLDTIMPSQLFGRGFLFKPNETNMKLLEDLFGQAGLDFHREALLFLRKLDTDKNAEFLDTDQTAKLGIALFSENASTLASRSLELRNNPDASFMWRLWGWSLSAYHNSVSWFSRSIKGNPKWWSTEGLKFQQFLAVGGTLAITGGAATGATEELIRRLKLLLYGEVAGNRHPWEEDDLYKQSVGWLQYSFALFPIFNIPINLVAGLGGASPKAASGVEFFYQSQVKRFADYGTGVLGTRDPFYKLDVFLKSTFGSPIIRAAVNASPLAEGHVELTNNRRLISTYADPAFRKESRGYYGGSNVTPVTAHVRNMLGYAVSGDWESFAIARTRAIKAAVDLEKPDPLDYVKGLYWGADPWRKAMKGSITLPMREVILDKVEKGYGEKAREDLVRTETNFNIGYIMLGGTPNRIKAPSTYFGSPAPAVSSGRRRKAKKLSYETGGGSGYRSTIGRLRRAYGV